MNEEMKHLLSGEGNVCSLANTSWDKGSGWLKGAGQQEAQLLFSGAPRDTSCRKSEAPPAAQPTMLMHAHGSPSSHVNPEAGGVAGGSRASHHHLWDFMHHKPPGASVPPPVKWVQVTVLLWGHLKGVVYTHGHAAMHRIMKLYTELQIDPVKYLHV